MLFSASAVILAALLAQAQPTSETTGNWILVFVAVACPIISLIFGAIGLWVSAKRNPPIAEEIAKALAKYVPREEHDGDVHRIHERIDATNSDVSAVRNQLSKAFADLENAIGRLQGWMDASEKLRHSPPHHHR